MPWRLVGSYRLAPEPDGSPLFTSSPSVTCQRYEPRKRPGPLAVSRYRDAAFPVEGSGRPLRSRSISGLPLRSLAFRPATFLSTLRSGCYQTPRKTRYTAAWLRLCRGRHFRRLNSTRLQGATLPKPDMTLSVSSGFPVLLDGWIAFGSCHCGYLRIHPSSTCGPSPCGRLSRPRTTTATPSPWASRPVGDPVFGRTERPSAT